MGFGKDITKFRVKSLDEVERLRKAVIFELFSSIILDTPVDTGRLRGNWIITLAKPSLDEVEIEDPNGSKTIAKIKSNSGDGIGKDLKVYFVNNLPYAHQIEFDGHSHTQAPEGMVRKNFIRVVSNLKAQSI